MLCFAWWLIHDKVKVYDVYVWLVSLLKSSVLAAKILPVVKNQHLLLCTLLIGNSLAMEVCRSFICLLILFSKIRYWPLLFFFPPTVSSYFVGQACASMGSNSNICNTHPHVWRGFFPYQQNSRSLVLDHLCLCGDYVIFLMLVLFVADTSSSNLHSLWIDCWGNSGTLCPSSSVDILPCCLSNQ